VSRATDKLERSLEQVDRSLEEITAGCDPLVVGYVSEAASARGKLIRPRLMLTIASIFEQADLDQLARCAACCELLHTATLIDDDVIDQADTRRGNLTLNNRYGNEIAVFVGDYVFALVLKAINAERDFQLMQMMLDTSQEMGLGIIEEIHHRNNFRMDVEKYYEVIYLKTAALFRLCCSMGAYLGGATPEQIALAGDYGKQLGLGFQIIDDLLDLVRDSADTGKSAFNDLREGRITLPLIHSLGQEPELTRGLIETFQSEPSNDAGAKVRHHLISTGSLGFARDQALDFIMQARSLVPSLNHARNGAVERLEGIEELIISAVSQKMIQAAAG
jgi:geranylgeranyl pyrophosphate synthase